MITARRLACVLSMLGAAACAQTGPDTPVSSTDAGSAQPVTSEGVSGIVTTAAGQPISDAFIQVSAAGAASGPIPDIAVLTDADGNFVWRLRPGSYRIAALVSGREVAAADVVVARGRMTTVRLQAK